MKKQMNKRLLAEFLPQINSRAILPNRGGYTVTMRESSGAKKVLETLSKEIHTHNSKDTVPKLHMGWGSYRNLDIIAARKSEYAIICDVSIRQLDVWSKTFVAITLSKDIKSFISIISEVLPRTPRPRYFGNSIQEWISDNQVKNESWLHKEETFKYIKNMVLNNKIELVCCDIREHENHQEDSTIFQLYLALKEMQTLGVCHPDTLYLTNLPWMMKHETGFFGENHNLSDKQDILSGYTNMLNNLKIISPMFEAIISAHELASHSTEQNLQWQTKQYIPKNFIKELEYEQ